MARIAVLSHAHHPIAEPYAGGLEMHTSMLARHLTRMGHKVVLFAKGGSDNTMFEVDELVPGGLDFKVLPSRSIEARRQATSIKNAYLRALERIDSGRFDCAINNTLNSAPLEWKTDIPVLTVFHTPVFRELIVATRMAAMQANHAFATVSEANAVDWRRIVPSVDVIHNGIDAKCWRPTGIRTDELRWNARITHEKGLHVAIVAARIAGRQMKVAGPISDIAYFENSIEPLLGDGIEYVGHLSHLELPEFLGTGAVALATPLWEEPFGLSIIEALACGTPVAAFPRGAMKELIASNVGAVSRDSAPTSLATAIEQAALCDSKACRAHVVDRFDANTMVDRYLEVLTSLGSRSGPLTSAETA